MRVSSAMMHGNYLKQLNRSNERQNKLMEQGDGNAIHRPSDDPVAFVRTMTFKNSLAENEQYAQNLKDAVSWMKTSDSAMVNMTDILKTISEKTIAAANGTNGTDDMAKIAQEIDSLIEQLVTLGNTQLGDRYVFAGQADKVQPFQIEADLVTGKADLESLDVEQQKAFGTDKLFIMTDANGTKYYVDYNETAPGSGQYNVYDEQYVLNGYKNTSINAGRLGTITTNMFDKNLDYQVTESNYFEHFNEKGQYIDGTPPTVQTAPAVAFTPAGGGATVNLELSVSDKRVVSYKGDDIKISMPIQNGDATPRRDSVNVTGAGIFGTDIFGGVGSSLLNDLYDISEHMKSGDNKWLSNNGIKLSETAYSQVLAGETELAARTQTYNETSVMFDSQNTVIKADINETSAAEVDKLIVELMTAQMLYNMSLSFGSKILPSTLADYL